MPFIDFYNQFECECREKVIYIIPIMSAKISK